MVLALGLGRVVSSVVRGGNKATVGSDGASQ
jgi:hypothetical protein